MYAPLANLTGLSCSKDLQKKLSGGVRNPVLVTLNLLLGFVLPQDAHGDEWKNSVQSIDCIDSIESDFLILAGKPRA